MPIGLYPACVSDRFHIHARTVSLLTMLSRFTGLARDAALARVFGVGGLMDAFFFAFMIPNLFRRLFGEGALAAAFLPVYSQLDRDDPATARQLASLTVASLVVVLGIIVIAGEAVLWLTLIYAEGDALAVRLMMIMLPYMPLVCVVAIAGAMLQVHGRFGPTAAAPIILNIFIIATTIGLAGIVDPTVTQQRNAHILVVASAVVAAGVVQVGWSLWALRDRRWWVRGWQVAARPFQRMLRQAGPMIVGLGVLQLNTFFDGVIASYPTTIGTTIFGMTYPLEQGAMAAISYAQRLYQFPLGVFGIAVATAIFPTLARLSNDDARFAATVRRGLRLVVFIGLPASAGLMLVAQPLVAVILQGGDFDPADTRRVAFVLLGYAPAVWAYSMTHVLTRAFYARSDALTPVKVAAAVVVLNLILNCTLIWTPLREAGLAWSTAICSVVQVTTLLLLFRRHVGSLIDRDVLSSWLRTFIITLAMAGVVFGLSRLLGDDPANWLRSFTTLLILSVAGMIVVGAAARALRMQELPWVLGRGE